MSAIGNYIHYSAKGYQKTGINKQKQKPSIDASQALAIQKKIISNKIKKYENIDQKSLDSLQKQIVELIKKLGYDNSSGSNIDNWSEQARQYLEEKMSGMFQNLQNLDFETGSVKVKFELNAGIGLFKENYLTYKNWRQELTNRVNKLNEYLVELNKMTSNKTGAPQKDYQVAIDKLNKLLNETYEKTWDKISNTGLRVNPKTTKNLIKELNILIKEYAAMPAINLQNGTFFEQILSIAPVMGQNLAEEAVQKEVEKAILGQSNVKVIIDKENFQDKSWKINLGDITEIVNTSQNKIDVRHEWEDKVLNISAKNLDLGKGYKFIHTTSGNSLLYMLQDESPDFVNHYLNLFSEHSDKQYETFRKQRSEYLDVLKLSLSYKGITGQTYGRENNITNVFIVNNYTGGNLNTNIKVVSVAFILNKFLQNQDKMLSVRLINGKLESLYKNEWVENSSSGAARIANILQQVHQRKITTAFNSSLLEKI